jgi:hypothetical protein
MATEAHIEGPSALAMPWGLGARQAPSLDRRRPSLRAAGTARSDRATGGVLGDLAPARGKKAPETGKRKIGRRSPAK